MPIKHPNLKLASCCLLAVSLLSSCGGSSSTTAAGGTDSRSYQQGVAHGTARALGTVLTQLQALEASLGGSGAPVQTSLGRVSHIVVAANLAPRQREQLAMSLRTFIDRIEAAKTAAEAATAGTAEADAAEAAASEALQALQLVVAADTAARISGDDEAQEAAIAALNEIAEVDTTADNAQEQIQKALNDGLAAAQADVKALEDALAAARAELGLQAGTSQEVIDRKDQQIAEITGASTRRATVTYHPRREGVEVFFQTGFDAAGSWGAGTGGAAGLYTIDNAGTAVTDGFDLTPDAVLYDPSGRNPRVFSATSPNTNHFPGRGSVYRGDLRYINDDDGTEANTNPNKWLYRNAHRLVEQGVDPEPADKGASTATNAGRWNNWDAEARMTFQHKANGGFTMGFGGTGLIFGDLERYQAGGCTTSDVSCNDPVTANVEISFGAPLPDRYGQPNTNFWYVHAVSPRLPGDADANDAASAITPDLDSAGDQVEEHVMGRYEMIQSAHAGADEDGANRRLSYAAYGLFKFIDFTISEQRVGRMQTFHYGLDAFADEADRRTTDLAADDVIEGTFRGKTAAYIVTSLTKTVQPGRFHSIGNMFRARGDIELRACIGGSGNCSLMSYAPSPAALTANQVAGKIDNLEYAYQNDPGHWTKNDAGGINRASGVFLGTDPNDPEVNPPHVELQPAAIGPDGAFSGATEPQNMNGAVAGGYEGAFYGPAGRGMEAAGTWRLNMSPWEDGAYMDAIIGSFGATCEGDCQAAP